MCALQWREALWVRNDHKASEGVFRLRGVSSEFQGCIPRDCDWSGLRRWLSSTGSVTVPWVAVCRCAAAGACTKDGPWEPEPTGNQGEPQGQSRGVWHPVLRAQVRSAYITFENHHCFVTLVVCFFSKHMFHIPLASNKSIFQFPLNPGQWILFTYSSNFKHLARGTNLLLPLSSISYSEWCTDPSINADWLNPIITLTTQAYAWENVWNPAEQCQGTTVFKER